MVLDNIGDVLIMSGGKMGCQKENQKQTSLNDEIVNGSHEHVKLRQKKKKLLIKICRCVIDYVGNLWELRQNGGYVKRLKKWVMGRK